MSCNGISFEGFENVQSYIYMLRCMHNIVQIDLCECRSPLACNAGHVAAFKVNVAWVASEWQHHA